MITYSQLQDLHEQIKTGKPVFSTRVQLNALDTIAMICSTGQFGYIELVEEYGSPLTIETINRACAVSSLPVIVKINRQNQESIAQNCITVGASGILFVEAASADDVRHCVNILRPASVDGGGLYGAM